MLQEYNGRSENYTKIIKLLYVADKAALEQHGASITGDKYVCMNKGPVLSYFLDLINGKGYPADQKQWNEFFQTVQFNLTSRVEASSVVSRYCS